MHLLDKFASALTRSGAASQGNKDSGVARVIQSVGGGIGSVPRCEERLGEALRHAEDYYINVVSAIPGPIPVSSERLGSVPVLGALFPCVEDLTSAFAKSIDVKDAVAKFAAQRPPYDSFHALMGMRRRDARPDAGAPAQTNGTFADHTVRSLGGDAEDTRSQIRDAAMQRLLKRFTARSERLRKLGKMLRSEWHTDLLLDNDPSRQMRADSGAHLSHHEFVHASQELVPEHLLDSLIEWLWVPEIHLRLINGADPLAKPLLPQKGNAVSAGDLPMMVSEDRRRWFVCLVQISADELLAAAKESARAHRYILI